MSSEKERDTVPSRSLPPVSSLDLRSDGRKIGPCPSCGGHRWWDNRGAKRAGHARNAADFKCAACGHVSMDEDAPASFQQVTVLETQAATTGVDASGPRGFRRCSALKSNGERCANGAMAGMDVCGPHASRQGGAAIRTCKGVTKAGKPCRAGAQRGKKYCPAHQDQQRRELFPDRAYRVTCPAFPAGT